MTKLVVGSATDVGLVRSNNQDQLLVSPGLYAVADGMGGHAAGEVASSTAMSALAAAFEATDQHTAVPWRALPRLQTGRFGSKPGPTGPCSGWGRHWLPSRSSKGKTAPTGSLPRTSVTHGSTSTVTGCSSR